MKQKQKRKKAAKKAAKKAKVAPKAKRAPQRKKPAAMPASLSERVENLERFVATLARIAYPSHESLAAPKGTAAAALVDGDLVDLRLTKLDTSPDLVRVTLRGREEVVLGPGAATGVVPNVVVGSFIELVIEVTGNHGDTASIAVTGAVPNSIIVKVPMNTGQTLAIRSLLVTG